MVWQNLYGTWIGQLSTRMSWKGYGEQKIFLWQYLSKKSQLKKVWWIIIDSKCKFRVHIKHICKRAFQKICILSRLSNDLNDSQKR